MQRSSSNLWSVLGKALTWLPGRSTCDLWWLFPYLSLCCDQERVSKFHRASFRFLFWGTFSHSLLVFLARQGRHLQMGPSSDRQSNAHTPVVPSVAQTWRKIKEVNVGRWAREIHWARKKRLNHRYFLSCPSHYNTAFHTRLFMTHSKKHILYSK